MFWLLYYLVIVQNQGKDASRVRGWLFWVVLLVMPFDSLWEGFEFRRYRWEESMSYTIFLGNILHDLEDCYLNPGHVKFTFLAQLFKNKRICRTVGPSLATSLEPLSLFCSYYFGRCSSKLSYLVPFPYSRESPTNYFDRLNDIFVTIPRCYKDVYSFSPHTARL